MYSTSPLSAADRSDEEHQIPSDGNLLGGNEARGSTTYEHTGTRAEVGSGAQHIHRHLRELTGLRRTARPGRTIATNSTTAYVGVATTHQHAQRSSTTKATTDQARAQALAPRLRPQPCAAGRVWQGRSFAAQACARADMVASGPGVVERDRAHRCNCDGVLREVIAPA